MVIGQAGISTPGKRTGLLPDHARAKEAIARHFCFIFGNYSSTHLLCRHAETLRFEDGVEIRPPGSAICHLSLFVPNAPATAPATAPGIARDDVIALAPPSHRLLNPNPTGSKGRSFIVQLEGLEGDLSNIDPDARPSDCFAIDDKLRPAKPTCLRPWIHCMTPTPPPHQGHHHNPPCRVLPPHSSPMVRASSNSLFPVREWCGVVAADAAVPV